MMLLLLDAGARALGLALLAGLGLKLFRVRNAHAELTVWTVVLVAAVAMPLLMQWTPSFFTFETPAVPVDTASLPSLSVSTVDVTSLSDVEMPDAAAPAATGHFLATLITGGYALIAAVLLVRLLTGLALTARIARAARPLAHGRLRNIRVSPSIDVPVTFASTILVPAAFTAWPKMKQDAVLAHEAAHAARGDFYVQVLAGLYRAVFWFSPLSWWLAGRLAMLAEIASDAAAVETVGERPSYAEILLDMASSGFRPVAGVAMARPNTVMQRIEQLLDGAPLPAKCPRRVHLLICAVLAPLVAFTASGAHSVSAAAPEAPLIVAPLPVAPLPVASVQTLPLKTIAAQTGAAQTGAAQTGESRTVPAFHAVDFGGSGKVEVTIGKTQSLVLDGDPELLRHITTETRDGVLHIYREHDGFFRGDHGPLIVRIVVPQIDGVGLSGSGIISMDGLNGGATKVDISGSGEFKATGRLDKLVLSISGSGHADLPDLTTDAATVHVSGSGNVTVRAKQSLDADISGSGNLRYYGTPPQLHTAVSGSGRIESIS